MRSISVDDNLKYLLSSRAYGNIYQPRTLFVVDIFGPEPGKPDRIIHPGATEREEVTMTRMRASFSLVDPASPSRHVAYIVTNVYGDFNAVVSYDINQRTVTHITTLNLAASVPVLKFVHDARLRVDRQPPGPVG